MTDLSHWDFAETFAGTDAAALILGLDPLVEAVTRSLPVLTLMERSYTATLHAHIDAHRMRKATDAALNFRNYNSTSDSGEDLHRQYRMVEAAQSLIFVPRNLHSWRMTGFYSQYPEVLGRTSGGLFDLDFKRFERWLEDDQRNGFFHQFFDREELHRWLNAIGSQSDYRFLKDDGSPENATSAVTQNYLVGRRDLLTHVIEHAQSLCRNKQDAPEIWSKLQTLARDKYSPLIGITETGIQYLDSADAAKTLSFRL